MPGSPSPNRVRFEAVLRTPQEITLSCRLRLFAAPRERDRWIAESPGAMLERQGWSMADFQTFEKSKRPAA